MADGIVVEHDEKMYEISLDDLAQYEVADDAAKGELEATRDGEQADSEDEVVGFGRRRLRRSNTRAWIIIRR